MYNCDVQQRVGTTATDGRDAQVYAPEDFLALQLGQLGVNVRNGAREVGQHDVVQSVHAAVRQLDRLIQRAEGGLREGKIN